MMTSTTFKGYSKMRKLAILRKSCGYSYILPIPKPKECYNEPLTCEDFRDIAISHVLSKIF